MPPPMLMSRAAVEAALQNQADAEVNKLDSFLKGLQRKLDAAPKARQTSPTYRKTLAYGRSPPSLERIRNECSIHTALSIFPKTRSKVVRLYRITHEREQTRVVLEMESFGEDLEKVVSGLRFADRKRVCTATRAAVRAMHAAGFAHMDLFAQNVLVKRGVGNVSVKLCDFGVSSKTAPAQRRPLVDLLGPRQDSVAVTDADKSVTPAEFDDWCVKQLCRELLPEPNQTRRRKRSSTQRSRRKL